MKTFYPRDVLDELRPYFAPETKIEFSHKWPNSVVIRRDNWQWRVRVFSGYLIVGETPFSKYFYSISDLVAHIKQVNAIFAATDDAPDSGVTQLYLPVCQD